MAMDALAWDWLCFQPVTIYYRLGIGQADGFQLVTFCDQLTAATAAGFQSVTWCHRLTFVTVRCGGFHGCFLQHFELFGNSE